MIRICVLLWFFGQLFRKQKVLYWCFCWVRNLVIEGCELLDDLLIASIQFGVVGSHHHLNGLLKHVSRQLASIPPHDLYSLELQRKFWLI